MLQFYLFTSSLLESEVRTYKDYNIY